MASPAIHASRPSGLIDPRQQGDYPIILGESLKGDAKSQDTFLNIRYNWQSKSGYLDGRESKLRKFEDGVHFDIPHRGPGTFQYVAKVPIESSNTSEDGTRPLALIFDESKSAFVLEAISTTLDVNLKVGPGMSREDARELPQLPEYSDSAKKDHQPNGHGGSSSDDETADASNPYDFRHFLAEARDNIEKSTQVTGNRTPLPGSRTPLSGTATPIPGGNRFLPTTPQFQPTQTKTTSKTAEQRPKKKSETVSRTNKVTTKPGAKRETPKINQPLSKATISDSSDSENETINVARAPTPKPGNSKPTRPPASKGHTRNISANIGSSPHIIINDDDGGLEIDMGSPPPEDERSRRRGRIDPEAFRSHTGTPVGGLSSNFRSTSRPLSRTPAIEEPARRHERERDGDVRMKDIEAASEDEDDDVEEFELGSPREKSSAPRRGNVSRDESDEEERHRGRPSRQQPRHAEQVPPTPPAAANAYGEDDDDLEAAIEAALEEESDHQSSGVGLGIGMTSHGAQDDESEVSEEE
ncbi:hypothetical protein H2200_005576 [Cladophialophora chaetospira]|uniref:Transcription elongation factor Eaf N-terminal domain-containing protein n=1 Tax=Cladophialophora chaetospira TaxID=386627 RepID=A0AA39CJ20_9EURO|nr:hypothetical protein H2200_005576 [Cladophialophora chaetospira]